MKAKNGNHTKIGIEVFVVNDGKILMGKRKNVTGDGTWGVPGGHLEYRERISEAAKRELFEETNLAADKLKYLSTINDPRDDDHYVHVTFLAEEWSGELKNREPHKCSELAWFSLTDLPSPLFFGHEKLLKAYKSKNVFLE